MAPKDINLKGYLQRKKRILPAYTVDKYFWLISTGKFYHDPNDSRKEVKVGGKRDEFIQDTKIRLVQA